MDTDSFPMEKIVQFVDIYGNVFVALDPEVNINHKMFIEKTIKEKGLDMAVIMYPYVPLKLENRILVPVSNENATYDARITNNFHIMKAKMNDVSFELHLQDIYSNKEEKEPLIVSMNKDNAVINDNEGIGITPNDKRSEDPIMIKQVTNWHPNRDANGNYMSAQQMNNYANYVSSVVSSPYYGQSYLSNPAFQWPF